ncbi:hypothetical protein [Reichenbachiella sp.]|uniref:hypothetical protein n=1 Tax=Reichenbachiella sp. TaxID=2184521 RepID=UPI0032980991
MKNNWYQISTRQFGYPQPEDDFGYLDRTYKPDTGCPTCGIGIVQVNPFRFKNDSDIRHNQFIGLNWIFDQIFVHESVKTEFEKNGITGVRFSQPVIHETDKPIESIYQIHVDTILSKGLIGDNLTTENCDMPTDEKMLDFLKASGSKLVKGPFCGHLKYNFPHGQKLEFNSDVFSGQPDFVRTHEWFGSGWNTNRPIIISERVKKLIEKNEWIGAYLEVIG